ncbi:CopG family transcriptional regulator [Neorhizobium alkalisoli]|uniref:Ribbon-helix-helix CopG family protein n=1 Tax=Neorhizobium alkalisoli TaxID=528178 RepID=A0A561R3C9_9HYPH|nr:CopG family transcriptional regulator [Neorhizobium alkalisoli]TWF57107.1 ribbon-helix-helix CopG family protein [Neorhizobium alkalisoli]
MRTLVELPEAEIEALDRLAQAENTSRELLIERAVRALLDKNDRQAKIDAYGLWGNRTIDGLEFQKKVRGEW